MEEGGTRNLPHAVGTLAPHPASTYGHFSYFVYSAMRKKSVYWY